MRLTIIIIKPAKDIINIKGNQEGKKMKQNYRPLCLMNTELKKKKKNL